MSVWNPWRGCHRYSDGCKFCYIHKGDAKRGVDTDVVVKTDKFYAPVIKYTKGVHAGEYKMKPGTLVYLCFSSDFLLPDADVWREECWKMIKERSDMHFLFLTKRIERFEACMPDDWGDGYDNVTVGCTVENKAVAEVRLKVLDSLPIKHKNIILQPLLESVSIAGHLAGVELAVVGGESDKNARPLDYSWVLNIRNECLEAGVAFQFRQTGSRFIKDGTEYTIPVRQQCAQARKAGINIE